MDLTTLQARAATEADLDRLAEWNEQLLRDEGHRSRMTQQELRARMRLWMAEEYVALIFAIGGEDVAYSVHKEDADGVFLRQLFVCRERRRRGIGRAVMRILFELWRGKRMTVNVLCANAPALNFYRSLGYQDYYLCLEILPQNPS
jgi:GNAT superfamily N-acetyltransferase